MKISAVTFFVKNMDLAVKFYSNIPGFEIVYGNSKTPFVTFKIEDQFLNLEYNQNGTCDFGRIIFHVNDVDKTYNHLKQSPFSDSIETIPTDASWGERFFYIRDPDNHQIAIAKPL
ncbi:MAG: VOC family protein [Nitrosopumilus sp.]|nr:VOC family protein [Nitrosopumilus sp.]MDH3340074.1 VOC family protein [Nitrosopumilus sp.]